ncbi:Hypothetical_protein [Hexamita inflata]|uniref:Hypothetical_protein n=1 Tax=Hexamita inflata TaxID=28002 RepID=A0AA86NUD5_9EUKA|nr:Hypothetical protein HINF_LOCUS13072 [Hexamita inflata]
MLIKTIKSRSIHQTFSANNSLVHVKTQPVQRLDNAASVEHRNAHDVPGVLNRVQIEVFYDFVVGQFADICFVGRNQQWQPSQFRVSQKSLQILSGEFDSRVNIVARVHDENDPFRAVVVVQLVRLIRAADVPELQRFGVVLERFEVKPTVFARLGSKPACTASASSRIRPGRTPRFCGFRGHNPDILAF